MTFKERIHEGVQGKYQGLSNGLNRVNRYLFGIQRRCYYLLGGLSGAAKTSLLDFFILNAVEDAKVKGISLNVFYYSFEIDEHTKKANWLSQIIYNKYQRVISPEKIKGLGEFRLDSDELEIVESEIPYLDEMFSKIHWIWESTNPTGIRNEVWRFMEPRGNFIKEEYINENQETKQRIVKYIPNSDEQILVIIDHVALMKRERGFNLKENIDKVSEYFVQLRNLFGITPIVVQQFNQGLNSVERAKFKGVDISPQQNDFRDSTNPYQDCDVALGIMNAYKMDMKTCLGYNINQAGALYNLREKFRMLKIIKNRLSKDDIAIGLLFFPESLRFEELPRAVEIDNNYIEYLNKVWNAKI